jgi:hypothetical protein
MGQDRAGRIAIITVHGTGDTAPEPDGPPDGEHWFLTGSRFIAQLKQRLAGRGVEADVFPHLWSGANSAMKREHASRKLVGLIRRLSKRYSGGVHVIGHSHGGNVANDAACMLNWSSKQRRSPIASITTVGTPFFRTRVTASERFGAWLFVIVVALSLFVFTPAATLGRGVASTWINEEFIKYVTMPAWGGEAADGCSFDSGMSASEIRRSGGVRPPAEARGAEDALRPWSEAEIACVTSRTTESERGLDQFFLGLSVATGVALLFMFPLSFRGVGRIRRAGRRLRSDASIRSIWHPNDEAIAFLSKLDAIPIEPFPRGSLWAGSRTGGIQWGVRAVLYTDILGAALLATGLAVGDALGDFTATLGLVVLAVGIAGAPLIFLSVYVLYRLFAALVLELGLRGRLNNTVGGALKSIAFGRDGDNRVGETSNRSHYYETELVTLSGDVEQRMLKNSAEASGRLFDRYRKAVFSADDGESNAVNQIANDSLTWDSLIHTTYFEQPEVVDGIAEHIVRSRRDETGSDGGRPG